ncbi:MAG: hypothetical protein ACRDVK_06570 [Acidimicrobiia bacterium]
MTVSPAQIVETIPDKMTMPISTSELLETVAMTMAIDHAHPTKRHKTTTLRSVSKTGEVGRLVGSPFGLAGAAVFGHHIPATFAIRIEAIMRSPLSW